MYVGPWQEYYLSKGRKLEAANEPSNKDASKSSDFVSKEELKRILVSSLDPLSAQRALEAIASNEGETLQQNRNNSLDNNFSLYKQPRVANRSRRILIQQPVRLPPLLVLDNSTARSAGGSDLFDLGALAPPSVRSTVSEPVRGQNNRLQMGERSRIKNAGDNVLNHQLFPAKSRLSSGQQGAHSRERYRGKVQSVVSSQQQLTQHFYDAASVISTLKMERAARPPSYVAQQAQSQNFRKFWGWSNDESKSNLGDGLLPQIDSRNLENSQVKNSDSSKAKAPSVRNSLDVNEKLVQIKKMQDIYQSKKSAEVNEITDEITKSSSSKSPTATDQNKTYTNTKGSPKVSISDSPLMTPRISDIDLTDDELAIISKYFNDLSEISSVKKTESTAPSSSSSSAAAASADFVPSNQFATLKSSLPVYYSPSASSENLVEVSQGALSTQVPKNISPSPLSSSTFSINRTKLNSASNRRIMTPMSDDITGLTVESLINWSNSLDVNNL